MKYIPPNDIILLNALALMAPSSSKNTLRSWVKEGRVEVDGERAELASLVIRKNQQITVGDRKKFLDGGITVLFEDKDLVVVEKPSGLLSVSTAFEKGETVHAFLKSHYHPRKVFVVHRLDQDTSGVMIFALSEAASVKLKEAFEVHAIERAYTAVVEGYPDPMTGTWESYQYEDARYVVHETEDPSKGKLAITHYRVIAQAKKYALLELTLETGRKNQIRVHCQSAGHPIVGDKKYGALANPIKRLCLHAHLLVIQHPFTKKSLKFTSPIPKEFQRIFQ